MIIYKCGVGTVTAVHVQCGTAVVFVYCVRACVRACDSLLD